MRAERDSAFEMGGGDNCPPRLLSARELAEVLGCDARRVYEMSNAGKIPYYTVGKIKKYAVEEVLVAIRRPSESSAVKNESQQSIGRQAKPHLKIEAMRR